MGGDGAPCISAIDIAEYPFDFDAVSAGLKCRAATLVVDDWDAQMRPWPAPGLYRGDADFAGGAAKAPVVVDESIFQVGMRPDPPCSRESAITRLRSASATLLSCPVGQFTLVVAANR